MSTQLGTEATLTLRLVQALIRQEIDATTEITMAPTSFSFNPISPKCLMRLHVNVVAIP